MALPPLTLPCTGRSHIYTFISLPRCFLSPFSPLSEWEAEMNNFEEFSSSNLCVCGCGCACIAELYTIEGTDVDVYALATTITSVENGLQSRGCSRLFVEYNCVLRTYLVCFLSHWIFIVSALDMSRVTLATHVLQLFFIMFCSCCCFCS